MAGLRLGLHRVIRALARLLALQLIGERGQRQHDLVRRAVERPLAVFQVEEDPHAGLDELFERVGRFDRLSTETALLTHDQDLKGRCGLQGVHQAEEAGALGELRSADAVVHVDVGIGHAPALLCRIGAGMGNLSSHGPLGFAHAVLIGALACVDRSRHGSPLSVSAVHHVDLFRAGFCPAVFTSCFFSHARMARRTCSASGAPVRALITFRPSMSSGSNRNAVGIFGVTLSLLYDVRHTLLKINLGRPFSTHEPASSLSLLCRAAFAVRPQGEGASYNRPLP